MVLHKYTKAIRGLSYLMDGLLRFSPISEFNDPFEMRPYLFAFGTPEEEEAKFLEMEKEAMEKEKRDKFTPEQKALILDDLRTAQLEKTRQQMDSAIKASIGILCLVEDRQDDLLMWAHYGDCHKGCVLEFDSANEWFAKQQGWNIHPLMGIPQTVKYEGNRPRTTLSDMGEEHLLTKADCWKDEHEVRILRNLQEGTTHTCDGKEVNGLFDVPREALTKIYLGVNIDPKDQDKFLILLPQGHSVGLFKFDLHEQEFALVPRRLN